MEKQLIVALGREFGSGGHYVGQKNRGLFWNLLL